LSLLGFWVLLSSEFAKENLIEIKVRRDNNGNDNPLLRLLPVIICPIVDFHLLFTSSSSYFPSPIGRLSIRWVWIIRLIEEIILLSAIFPIRLVSCWKLSGREPPLNSAMEKNVIDGQLRESKMSVL
jgi:hypothetical protein